MAANHAGIVKDTVPIPGAERNHVVIAHDILEEGSPCGERVVVLSGERIGLVAAEYLASREGSLTATMKPGPAAETMLKKERKVALGTIPDFSYKGEGVRIEGVIAGSPAEVSGLKKGDVLIRINSWPLHGLKDLSDILKSLSPGDRVSITFLREKQEMIVKTELKGK